MASLGLGWGVWLRLGDLTSPWLYAFVKFFGGYALVGIFGGYALVGGFDWGCMNWIGEFDVALVGGYAFVKPWVICLG